MTDATYWWDEALKFAEQAEDSESPGQREEFLELADVCKDVAARIDQRSAGG
jgi:hypothetical protein